MKLLIYLLLPFALFSCKESSHKIESENDKTDTIIELTEPTLIILGNVQDDRIIPKHEMSE